MNCRRFFSKSEICNIKAALATVSGLSKFKFAGCLLLLAAVIGEASGSRALSATFDDAILTLSGLVGGTDTGVPPPNFSSPAFARSCAATIAWSLWSRFPTSTHPFMDTGFNYKRAKWVHLRQRTIYPNAPTPFHLRSTTRLPERSSHTCAHFYALPAAQTPTGMRLAAFSQARPGWKGRGAGTLCWSLVRAS